MKLASLLVLVAACVPPLPGPNPVPHDADAEPPPSPPERLEGGPRDAGDANDECAQPGPLDDCRAAGLVLCRLACRSSAGVPLWKTPGGTPYAAACRRAVLDDRDTTKRGGSRARCLSAITSCTQIESECR